MAFESLAPFIDLIEKGFADKKSPRAIARELGNPNLYSTINRYKVAVWGLKGLVKDAKDIRAQKHEGARGQAVEEVVKTLDVLHLGLKRAKQLLEVNIGDKFLVSDGSEHTLTLGSASVYWPTGMNILFQAAKLEMELSGDDAEGIIAQAMSDWEDARVAILKAVEDHPEVQKKIIEALKDLRG